MNSLHQNIDKLCDSAQQAIKHDAVRAQQQIDDIIVRYRNQDVFRRRSEGQKRRRQNEACK